MADRVFEGRLGVYIIDAARGRDRLPALRAFGGGIIRDLFWPRTSSAADLVAGRQAGFYSHLWAATDGLSATAYVQRTLADIVRTQAGAAELNIELPDDPPLPPYVRTVVMGIRAARPSYRLRIGLAPWKGFAIPADLLAADAALYVDAQTYEGNMENLLSPEDVAQDLRAHGAPAAKVTVCYGAACRVLGSSQRLRTLPDLSRARRGVIFSDDLMVEAGLL